MRGLLDRLRVALVFGALVVACLVTMLADRGALRAGGRDLPWWSGAVLELAVPVQKMIATPVDVVEDVWERYLDLLGVRDQNERLRAQLAQLEEENVQLREALVASGRLQRIAEMRSAFEIPMLPAEVAGHDASPWFRSVLLDRGHSHGVRAGMPVISEDGVVGLVTATSQHAAQAMLLHGHQSAVDAVVQRSRARGIVRGLGGGEVGFEFVARGADVQVGDTVLTSGVGGVFPKGLRVGSVAELPESGSGLLRTALLEPSVDFSRLEQVFVLLWRSPTMELLHQGPGPGRTADAPGR